MRFLAPLVLLCACPPAVPPPPPLVLEVASDGAFSLSREGVGLSALRASVTVSGVEVALTSPAATSSESDDELGHAKQTTLEQTAGTTKVTLTLRAYEGFVTARLAASCEGGCPGARVEGFTLRGDVTGDPTAALANGYSSWAPSYYATVQRSTEPGAGVELVGNNDNHLTTDARLSWWVSAIDTKSSKALVVGALTAQAWKTKVLTWRDEGVKVRVRSGGGLDSLPLTVEGVQSERFFFTAGAALTDSLSTWSRAVATLTPPPEVPFVPVGWNSWNTLFEEVSEPQVLANAARLKTLGFPANNVQLDDGWEQAWGNWTANPKFPSGMDGLATQLNTQQLNAGVWMAPFFMDSTLPMAMANPGWFVRDAAGRPIGYTEFFTGHTLHSLDTTNPEARAWMVGEVRRLLAQGYRYLKLDFLFAGAWEGQRQDPDVTSLQAFQLGMKAIMAEAQGAGAYVVACGAPVLPSAGVAHALRTGEDIAARGTPYGFDWVKNASRNVGVRWFVTPFLASDADTILVRGLPDGVKRIQTTTNLLAGRLLGLGDDLTALQQGELDFLAAAAQLPSIATMSEPGAGFVPLDAPGKPRGKSLSKAEALVDSESYFVPSLWAAKATSEGTLVGVLNWSQQEQTFTVSAASLGLEGTESAQELWVGLPVTFAEGAWRVTVPARDAAYLRLR
ncbi:MAG: alpha-galactosidase [Archangium sp.]|nr:alpha-galactosidase [Archangium sp.]